MDELILLFEKNLLEHFLEQQEISDKRKEEDYDEVGFYKKIFSTTVAFVGIISALLILERRR